MRLVRTVEARRGIGSSELVEWASRGNKFRYGSPVCNRALESAGMPAVMPYVSSSLLVRRHQGPRMMGSEDGMAVAHPFQSEGDEGRHILSSKSFSSTKMYWTTS